MSPLGGLPRPPFSPVGDAHSFTAAWGGWFSIAASILQATSTSGTTAQRPTPTYAGQFYFDTTLGFPIWCKTPGASAVWVNATGTPS